jgi:Holliday junction DNA helicase RuvB
LKRARDFAEIHGTGLSLDTAHKALDLLGVDEMGLTPIDRKLLTLITEKFGGGPVGLSTLAAALSEDPATIEEVHEPYLLQLGFIERSPRGRIITSSGREHLGAFGQKTLL